MAVTVTAEPTVVGLPSSVAVVEAAFGSAVMVKLLGASYFVLSAMFPIVMTARAGIAKRQNTATKDNGIRLMIRGIMP
jgi:hypothetical protein